MNKELIILLLAFFSYLPDSPKPCPQTGPCRLVGIEKLDGVYRLSWRRYREYFGTVCDTMPALVKGCWYPDSVSGYKKVR